LAEFVLEKFAQGDWKAIDAQFERGEISLEECLKREFSLVKASREQILSAVEDVVAFRPSFDRLAVYCKEKKVPLIIVSAGMDFVINHLLKLNGWQNLVKMYVPKAKFTDDGIGFMFPRAFCEGSVNFKHDLVRHYKSKGVTVVYVGDGTGDFAAAREADIAFAIEGSKLEKLCRKHKVPCRSIADFQIVLDTIRKMMSHPKKGC
jgi:2,3-diketo-5-methylthio-1-phosphopentane phosphatase